MKTDNEMVNIGIIWGAISALLFLLFPETFNIYWSGGQSGLIPEFIVILLLLPIYIISWTWNIIFPMTVDPWSIIYIAPIFIVISMIIGGLILQIITKNKK